jgi:hypothetical protein
MPPARTKAAAAVEETNGTPTHVDFRGLELTGPPVLPGELLFDLAALEDEDTSLAGLIGVLRTIFGIDQLKAIRAKIAADRLDFSDTMTALGELIDHATRAYGMEPGEAEASDAS